MPTKGKVSGGGGRARAAVVGEMFDRSMLPTATSYLQARGFLPPDLCGHWITIRCPIHKGGREANPSLRVSVEDGHFRCMACGVKGGDVLALHRLITGAGFVQAARELGALR